MGSWVAALKEDKNEIFRAAKDANQAADFVLALQKERTVEKALDGIPELRRETSEHVAAYEPGSGTVDLIEKESATEHRAVTANGRPKSGDRMAGAGLEAEKILDGEVNGRRAPGDLEPAEAMAKEALGGHARLYPAHTDSGRYTGEILGSTNDHIVQKLNAQSAVAHPKNLVPGQPEPGQNLVISYSNGQAALKAFEPKSKSKELAR